MAKTSRSSACTRRWGRCFRFDGCVRLHRAQSCCLSGAITPFAVQVPTVRISERVHGGTAEQSAECSKPARCSIEWRLAGTRGGNGMDGRGWTLDTGHWTAGAAAGSGTPLPVPSLLPGPGRDRTAGAMAQNAPSPFPHLSQRWLPRYCAGAGVPALAEARGRRENKTPVSEVPSARTKEVLRLSSALDCRRAARLHGRTCAGPTPRADESALRRTVPHCTALHCTCATASPPPPPSAPRVRLPGAAQSQKYQVRPRSRVR